MDSEIKALVIKCLGFYSRKTKIAEILTTYSFDQYNNTTIQ